MGRKRKLHLEKIVDKSPRSTVAAFDEYRLALSHFWNGDTVKAIEKIGGQINELPSFSDTFPFYRLWVECLNQVGDASGLRALGEHLFIQADHYGHKDAVTGLVGLIHLRLDEVEAASFYAESLSSDSDDSYVSEFLSEYLNRLSVAGRTYIPFVGKCTGVWDYFSLRCLASALVGSKFTEELKYLKNRLESFYGKCPVSFGITLAGYFEKASYKNVFNTSKRLAEAFPKNPHFQSLVQTASVIVGENSKAVAGLVKSHKKSKEFDDLLVVSWCVTQTAETKGKTSSSPERTFKSMLENEFELVKTEAKEGGDRKWWLSFVDSQLYDTVSNHRGEELTTSLRLGPEVKKGDLILLSKKVLSKTRILGVFEVSFKNPRPLSIEDDCRLSSIFIFEKSVELDLHVLDEDENAEMFSRFGLSSVFSLDSDGLVAVLDEVEDQIFFEKDVIRKMQGLAAVGS